MKKENKVEEKKDKKLKKIDTNEPVKRKAIFVDVQPATKKNKTPKKKTTKIIKSKKVEVEIKEPIIEQKVEVENVVEEVPVKQDVKIEEQIVDNKTTTIEPTIIVESKPVDSTPIESTIVESTPIKVENKEEKKKKKRKLTKEYLKTPLAKIDVDPNIGLNDDQIQERIDKGFVNVQQNVITKSYWSIFRSNVITLFNIINFFLGCAVLVFGSIKNALFLGIVVVNMVVGIFQEVRSKRTLEKMSLLTAPTIDVIRNGQKLSLPADKIVVDDVVILKQGAQVPVDCYVLLGECDANESLLTGEQDDIKKNIGDELLSGSVIQAGEVRCRATAVGSQSYSSKLMAEAKKFKKTQSNLMKSINWIIKIVTILIFPLGILMFFNNYNVSNHMLNITVTKTVSSIIGMIPEGLIVLTSIALAAGVYKLAKKRTLVQDLYSIETLARVDVLCLDKTGTITEGSMQVEKTQIYSSRYGAVEDIVGNMVKALGPNNATFEAFAGYFKPTVNYEIVKTIPFSSARKWSAVDFGIDGTYLVGAPEFVLKDKFSIVEKDCRDYTQEGFRVLVLVRTEETLTEVMDPSKMSVVSLIILSDKIRESANETFQYFAEQGVTLKVISGDNPLTVSKVAERAGLLGADKYIDASKDLDTPEKIFDACDKYTIFGRVNPKQKKQLVQALKAKGYTVGMTGDGVNDVMALKEADCSIAMAAGSEASRAVAQLVLLDSDFASLPSVVSEGRRVINNIQRAASLFLVKTTFSAVLTILCIIFSLEYPFEAIQLTLVSSLFVGVPSFFLALEPNNQKVEGKFLSTVFKNALPAGFTIALLVFIMNYRYSDIGINVSTQVSTMACYIYAMVSFIVLVQVCMPYNKERLFLVLIMLFAFMWCITTTITRDLFSLVTLTSSMYIRLAIVLICVLPTMLFMRVEIEAVTNLIKETKLIFTKYRNKAKEIKDILNRNK